jgi:mediator of RNA polymerase II transcription subunit 13
VPTPVSPSSLATEQTKSFEAAGSVLAKEVVTNGAWSRGWLALTAGAQIVRQPPTLWYSDVLSTKKLLSRIDGLHCCSTLGKLFTWSGQPDLDHRLKLDELEPPQYTIAKGDALIHILPSALRFWDKLGLCPRSGKKDITAYVWYEDPGDYLRQEMSQWVNLISSKYEYRQFGRHMRGLSSRSTDGLVPSHPDQFVKGLGALPQSYRLKRFY